jgi:flavin reductase (DIM6/NTAB) family NADH-FMN oxidoreductase RutF
MAKVTVAPSRPWMTTPVVLMSLWGDGSSPNIITLAWSGIMCGEPPTIYGSVRSQRFSHSLLKQNGDFVINLPLPTQVKEVDICGTKSGRDEDKFSRCGFTAEKAAKVDAPIIVECPVNLECRTLQVLELGAHDAFVAEVINVQVDENVFTEAGKVDPAFAPLVYQAASRNYHTTEKIEGAFYGYSIKK